ncbi:MAG TPA: FAD-dependent oxidoreductase [Rectinemataceae bacterium]|nr:FAD-dependent oxidoreductase [Rectinemataceae bacterium]
MQDRSREQRIGIVGAGAAGLSLACYLADAGYRRITILERDSQPGGKCRSWRSGGRAWELGAILATTDYEATLDMMARAGVRPWRAPAKRRAVDDSFVDQGIYPSERLFPGWIGLGELGPALWQILKYHALARKWPAVFSPRNDDLPPELSLSFAEWAERYRMGTLAKLYALPFTSFGYGYYDEVPAAYVLKYFEPGITRSLVLQGKFFSWEEGVQSVWERIARSFDVRYGTRPVRVRRRNVIALRCEDGSELEFDRLILTSPLDESLSYLDADAEETELFGRIRHTDYRVFLCHVRDMRIESGFAPCRFGCEGTGRPMIWDRRHADSDLHTFYVLGSGQESDAEIEEAIAADVRLLGGTFTGTETSVRWKYFPHVGSEDLAGGYYRRLEALQGRQSTYYAGELLAFSTIERSVRYSRDLVERFFA